MTEPSNPYLTVGMALLEDAIRTGTASKIYKPEALALKNEIESLRQQLGEQRKIVRNMVHDEGQKMRVPFLEDDF